MLHACTMTNDSQQLSHLHVFNSVIFVSESTFKHSDIILAMAELTIEAVNIHIHPYRPTNFVENDLKKHSKMKSFDISAWT